MYVRLELLDKAEPTSERTGGKDMLPTREMQQMVTLCSQSYMFVWDSLGNRCARPTVFNTNTGIPFLIGSKPLLAHLLMVNPASTLLRLLWTTQLWSARSCTGHLRAQWLCFLLIRGLYEPLEALLSTQPLPCKIHGNVSSWETSPSLLTAIKTSQLVQWSWWHTQHWVSLFPKERRLKGDFSHSEKHNADALFIRRQRAAPCFQTWRLSVTSTAFALSYS